MDRPSGEERMDAARAKGIALALHAARQPDGLAISSPTGDRTFAGLDGRANALARALRRRGLGDGSGVALVCANRPEFAEVWAATQRAGLRLTPVNWHLTAGEAAYVVEDCEAVAVVVEDRFPALAEAALSSPTATVRMAVGGPLPGFESYDDAVAAESPDALEDPTLGSTMLYTSGTTGRPKGVHRSERVPTARVTLAPYGYRDGDVNLCTGPLYHAAPLAFSLSLPLLAGTGVVLMDGWDAEEALRLIEAKRVTHSHMVPTMFSRLLALPDEVRDRYDLSSLRFVIHGAAPCPVGVKGRLIEWLGPIVHEYYAATEGVGTSVDAATWLTKPGTVGKVRPPGQVVVGDEEATPLPTGEAGLLWLRAPAEGRFHYFKDSVKTGSTYRGDYFTLGDVGYLDDDGFLFLTDRSANLIISGGVNIYPAEVDGVLLDHPAVGDVATIGVPSEEWGEEVKAVVEPGPGVTPGPELAAELIAFCRERLAGFKCPRTVDFVEALPRADNGKIYKRVLRERYRRAAG
ncbi:MAG: AMP-binding protein [Acidimicrobiia bacterium]|nr:AMP-binding protein [Acidimicrobiia bacterium]